MSSNIHSSAVLGSDIEGKAAQGISPYRWVMQLIQTLLPSRVIYPLPEGEDLTEGEGENKDQHM